MLEGARELQVDYVNKLMFWIIGDALKVSGNWIGLWLLYLLDNLVT